MTQMQQASLILLIVAGSHLPDSCGIAGALAESASKLPPATFAMLNGDLCSCFQIQPGSTVDQQS